MFKVPSNISVTFGLQWNFIGEEPIDLDASCVAFDKDCNAVDVVFFNHLESENKYMVHSGDNRTGEDDGGDDESITFNMARIPPDVYYMMVCVTSYNGSDFRLVESANVRVINNVDNSTVGNFALSVVGQHTASLLCVFSREVPTVAPEFGDHQPQRAEYWDLREINKPCFGFSFCHLLPEMMRLLGIEDPNAIRERVENLPDYSLEKNNDVDDMELSQLRLGLGWDGENDLDASAILVGDDGEYIDHVHAKYGKLRSRDGAITHSGDKLNGYAVKGDDEFIDINLMRVNEKVRAIYFVAILYDGLADALNEVPKCYIRMQNKASPNDRNFMEVARLDINAFESSFTALVAFAAVRQSATHWKQPLARVEQGLNGRDWVDLFPFVRTFHRITVRPNLDPIDWPRRWTEWKSDLFPFAVRVTFGGVRNLSPQEPHFFRAHCLAWVQDKRNSPRYRSDLVSNREHIHFNGSFDFIVDKLDVLRVMVYETAMVGWCDIPMTDFFGRSGRFPASQHSAAAGSPMNHNNSGAASAAGAGEKAVSFAAGLSSFSAFSDPAAKSVAGGVSESREDDEEMRLMGRQPTAPPGGGMVSFSPRDADGNASHDGNGAASGTSATLPPENSLLTDRWFPLVGQDVSGEIHLRLERVPLPDAPKQGKSSCCVM